MVLNYELVPSYLRKMKKRNLDFLKTNNHSVVQETNSLLLGNLLSDLLETIKETCVQYHSVVCSESGCSNVQTLIAKMIICSELLFFICYQTQLVDDEEKSLMELIRYMSNLLIVASDISDDKHLKSGGYCEWQLPLLSVLISLQISQVCSLQQNTCLLSRDQDYSQITSLSQLKVGNSLQIDKFCILHQRQNQFSCMGVVGVTLLCYAATKHVERASKHDVAFYINAACQCGAFSYLRLVVLPVLQANYGQKKELYSFFVEVLTDLMENISDIVGNMGHSKHVFDNCVPPSREFYVDYFDQYAVHSCSCCVCGTPQSLLKQSCIDAMDDCLCLYIALMRICPRFSVVMCTKHVDCKHLRSTFVTKVMSMTVEFPNLLISVIDFLSAMCCASKSITAVSVFSLVEKNDVPLLSWTHFISVIELVSSHLTDFIPESNYSLEMSYPMAHSNYSLFSTIGGGGTVHVSQSGMGAVKASANIQCPYILSNEDVEGLLAICEFIDAVSVSEEIALKLFQKFGIVSRLFRLLLCSIPVCLKGAIMTALSTLGGISSVISVEIWGQMEIHRLFTWDSCGLFVGLQEDIINESRTGKYYLTEGFLKLIQRLLIHGVPNSLGVGYRVPGISNCLAYCVNDILIKSKDWNYSPCEWPAADGQRWRLTARAVLILVEIVQHYNVNAFSPEAVASYASGQETFDQQTKQILDDFVFGSGKNTNFEGKSSSFMIMCNLLSKSVLFEFLVSTLKDCIENGVVNTLNDHCAFEIGSAVDLLHKLHHLTVGANSNTAFLLSDLGREHSVCDPVYWKERTLCSILGLFYEVSLRERAFKLMLSTLNSDVPKSLMGSGELCVLLVSASCLPLLVHVLSSSLLTNPSSLSAHVMAVRLLEQILLKYPASWVVSALQASDKNEDVLGLSSLLVRTLGVMSVGQYDGSLCNDLVLSRILHFEIIPLGGDCFLDYFSPSVAFTFQPPPNIGRYYGSDQLSTIGQLCTKIELYGNVRGAILNLFLTTLQSTYSAVHCVLLSCRGSLHQDLDLTPPCLHLSPRQYNLEVLLTIMSPSKFRGSFLKYAPSQAVDCFEIVYRLSCCAESSDLILYRLSESSMQFYADHFLALLSALDESCDNLFEASVYLCLAWIMRTSINQIMHRREQLSSGGLFKNCLLKFLFDRVTGDKFILVTKLMVLIGMKFVKRINNMSDFGNKLPWGILRLGKSGNGFSGLCSRDDERIVEKLRKYAFFDMRFLNTNDIREFHNSALLHNVNCEMYFAVEYCLTVLEDFFCVAFDQELLRCSFCDFSDDEYCQSLAVDFLMPLVDLLKIDSIDYCKRVSKILLACISNFARYCHSDKCDPQLILLFSQLCKFYLHECRQGVFHVDSMECRSNVSSIISFFFKDGPLNSAVISTVTDSLMLALIDKLRCDVELAVGEGMLDFLSSLIIIADCIAVCNTNSIALEILCNYQFVSKLVQFNISTLDPFEIGIGTNRKTSFSVCMNMCLIIASSASGIKSLLNADIFSVLNSFSYFNLPPTNCGDYVLYMQHFLIVLHFFDLMFNGGVEYPAVAVGVIEFALANRNALSNITFDSEIVEYYVNIMSNIFWKLRDNFNRKNIALFGKDCVVLFQGLLKYFTASGCEANALLYSNLPIDTRNHDKRLSRCLKVAVFSGSCVRFLCEILRSHNVTAAAKELEELIVAGTSDYCQWFLNVFDCLHCNRLHTLQPIPSAQLIEFSETLLCVVFEIVEFLRSCKSRAGYFPRIVDGIESDSLQLFLRENSDVLLRVVSACEKSPVDSLHKQVGVGIRLLVLEDVQLN